MNRQRIAAAAIVAAFAAAPAAGAEFPTKPIRLVNGFAAGGPAELISRVIAGPLGERLGQPIVVESRPGASGIIATEATAKADPDGHFLGLFIGGHTVAAALNKKLPYDSVESFQPITSLVFYAFVVTVRADHPARTIQELLAQARAKPGDLTFGSAGNGTTSHLIGELMNSMAGVKITHIPYKGDAGSMAALLAGDIATSISTTVLVTPRVQAGKVRALAITSANRWSGLAAVPTLAESGLAGFDATTWAGIMGPKGMPRATVDRIHGEVQRVIALPEVKARLEQIVGGEVRGQTPEEMRTMLVSQIGRWTKVVQDANIKSE